MDFCQRFGPEIAYCLWAATAAAAAAQLQRQHHMHARVALALFPWGVMAVEACGALACLAQYTTVPCCLRACVLRDSPTPSLAYVDRRKENFHGGPRRPRAGVGDDHAGGGNFVQPDCVLVITIGFKSLFPHWATSALHGYVPTTSWYQFSVGGVTTERWSKVPCVPDSFCINCNFF